MKARIKIKGMSCDNCIVNVHKAIFKLPGVNTLNVRVGEVIVEFNPPLTTLEKIHKAIEDEGYIIEK
jgi:copper chaperone CopZ